jgi:hypothetical protein
MRAVITLFAFLLASPVFAQVTSLERIYGERVAMRALDQRCNLLTAGPRRALSGFTGQARGAALRAGSQVSQLNLISRQAISAVATKSCADPNVTAEAARVIAAHKGWRTQMTAVYPGIVRQWRVDRSGLDSWRAVQELGGGVRAGFVGTGQTLAFAVETPDATAAGARLFLRDASRLGAPAAGQRLAVPLRIGTTTHVAAARRPANTKVRIGTPSRAGTMLIFSDDATREVLIADPRDSFEVEITNRTGQITRVIVEVGDIIAAFAFAAEF